MKVSFTGRRPKDLLGYNKNAYMNFVNNDLYNYLFDVCRSNPEPDTPVEFISGGAQGFDQMAFWSVNKLKAEHPELNIVNTVFVPYRGQENRWPADTIFGRNDFNKMLAHADNVNYLNGALASDKAVRKALFDRNHAMVNSSDFVIALYPDDEWRNPGPGGTAECMRYANKHNTPIKQLCYSLEGGTLSIDHVVDIEPEEQAVNEHAPVRENGMQL